MNRSLRTLAGATLVAGAATAALTATALTGGSGAGASTATCTAWASMPSRVAITARHVVVRPQLVGTAGCRAQSFDGGATADLREPAGSNYPQRWQHFGDREQVDLYAGLDDLGRYVAGHGDVQVYDAEQRRVSSTWRTTSTDVRYGSRFVALSGSGRTVHARLQHFDSDGWQSSSGVAVALQQKSGGAWHTVSRSRSTGSGRVILTRRDGGAYRLVSATSSGVWGARTLGSARSV